MSTTRPASTPSDESAAATAFIPLSAPTLRGREWEYLKECLDTNWVSSVGPFVDRFEREFAEAVGAPYAVACASGTAALHVAMRLAGVGPGDEVFVSSLTFVGSLNPILYEQAVGVLVDAESRSWNMDPQLVVEEIERRARTGRKQPRAVEVVHVLGHPADIAPIVEVCHTHGIVVIEDAAEALGASYVGGPCNGKQVGTIGDIGCFSFNGNKVITTGGGGMIVTGDPAAARRARHLTTQARRPGLAYDHDEIGYNYRLPNLAAALGVAQLEQLPAYLEAKRASAARYDRALGGLPGLTLPPRAPFASPSMWLYSVLIDAAAFGATPTDVIGRLREANIESRPIWTPLHTMELYAALPRLGGRVSERIFSQGLSLPSAVSLTAPEQDRVIDVVRARAR